MIHAARRYAWLLSVGLLLIAAARPANLASAAEATAPETQPQRDARLKWWRDARFGMVIHWGPVSLVGTEISWSRGGERRGIGGKGEIPLEVYDNLYKQFDPAKFDAKVWVDLAQRRRHEIHGPHGQALRRLLPLVHQSRRLSHRQQSLPPRRLRRIGRRGAQGRHADRLVLLAHGLARPRLPHRTQRPIRRPHANPPPRVAEQLRPHRPAMVRLGQRAAAVGPASDLCPGAQASAADHHQQPPGPRPAAALQRPRHRRPQRRLLHARAASRRLRRPPPLGDVHDPRHAMVVEAQRPDQVAPRVHPHPWRAAPAATATCC